MPIRLVALQFKLNAKHLFFKSIRHSPGFGIATQIVRSNIVDATFRRALFHNAPDHFRTETGLPDALGLVDGPKYRAGADSGGSQPVIHCHFNPVWHGYGANMPSFTDQVGD